MESTESSKWLNSNIESYILNHPYHMFVLISKNDINNFEILYANSLAKDYFSREANGLAALFFGDSWLLIAEELADFGSNSIHTTTIQLTKEGTERYIELYFQSRMNDSRQELIFIELQERMDIQIQQENALMWQHKYMSVIDHNLDPILSVGQNRKVMHANPSVQTTFGYSTKEISGRSILNYVLHGDVEQLDSFLTRALSGESIELEGVSLFHKKGHYVPTYLKAIPVIVDDIVTEIQLIIRDTSFHQESNELLHFLSYHDQLTGLWNRQALEEHFIEDSMLALKGEKKLSYVHLDLDRFKLLNDLLGHNGADVILKMVAERLKMICPTGCRLYRIGGDEFIISLQNHTVSRTEQFVDKILTDFGKPFYYNHQEYFLSASIGISVYPEDGITLEELLRKSEQALVFVKERGRSHYRFYREEMNLSFPDEALMESHLRRAIELDELTLHYQPQVDLKTGHISSFEALLRWNNRKFGFVSPVQFIPIAEDSGLIHSIGGWVLDQVCMQLREWQDKKFRPIRVAVNISSKQFRMESFAEVIKAKISHNGIIPSSLEVEITESALTNMDETLATLNELKKIGVFISVDDFGTGYSSLSYLKQYPIDIIKIDRSFIKDIETDEKNEAIAKTIINLAHNLGMTVVAEGVEKDLQARILLEANCQKAQGFLYSKAVPVSEIVEKYFMPDN